MRSKIPFATGIACCLALASCDRNPSKGLTPADVTGTWVMTPESRALIRRENFVAPPGLTFTMTSSADGSFTVSTAVQSAAAGYTSSVSGGTWTLEHNTGGVANALRMNMADGIRHYYFTGSGGAIRLWEYHLDPDRDQHIEYVRQ